MFLLLVIHLFWSHQEFAQSNHHYTYSVEKSVPGVKPIYSSFSLTRWNHVFVPVDGGIYNLFDSIWFIPPSGDYYFTSVAVNDPDTAFFVVANQNENTKIFYIKASNLKNIKKIELATISKGVYNITYKHSKCVIWGFDNDSCRIGILTTHSVKWLVSIKEPITQVQMNNNSEILFSTTHALRNISTSQLLFTTKERITGFDFDRKNNLVVSYLGGTGIMNGDTLHLISRDIFGLVMCHNDSLYLLNQSKRTLNIVY